MLILFVERGRFTARNDAGAQVWSGALKDPSPGQTELTSQILGSGEAIFENKITCTAIEFKSATANARVLKIDNSGLDFGSGNILPIDSTNAISTGVLDLGAAGYRFKNIYGTVLRSVDIVIDTEPDDDANYTTTTEEYTDTEYYTVEVPVVERPGTGTADIQDGVSTADLVDGDERQTQTITKSREVTKTREVKTYIGPTLDVKEELQSLRARATQQDEVIAMMTKALKDLGADVSAFPAPDDEPPAASRAKTTKKK